jgi:hypothetical protein
MTPRPVSPPSALKPVPKRTSSSANTSSKQSAPRPLRFTLSTDADFGRGTQKTFNADDLSVVAAALTITSGAGTDIAGFGLTLTGGSGSIALVTGDTATFEVRPKNSANASFTLGGVASIFPEFGAIVMAKKQGTGQMCELDLPRVKGEGVPLGFDENKFSEADIKCTVMYDATLDYVARGRFITPTTPN